MWRLEPDSDVLRTAAYSWNEALFRKSGKQEYLGRLSELADFDQIAAARAMPRLASEAVPQRPVSPDLLLNIDRFIMLE